MPPVEGGGSGNATTPGRGALPYLDRPSHMPKGGILKGLPSANARGAPNPIRQAKYVFFFCLTINFLNLTSFSLPIQTPRSSLSLNRYIYIYIYILLA